MDLLQREPPHFHQFQKPNLKKNVKMRNIHIRIAISDISRCKVD